ncbi:MAG: addiction module protein [Oceanospirillum sp.]|nr:addiction module protein [Oceanospirillum sp.]
MKPELRELPISQRVQLVEDIWDSIAEDQGVLSVTQTQKNELDRRLENYQKDGDQGRKASDALDAIRKKL